MTDNTQELDEILEKVRYAAYYADYHASHTQEHINSIIAEHVAEQKQAIIDWHNKQIEKAMAKFSLKRGFKYDVKATDSVIVITPANKLKEAEL